MDAAKAKAGKTPRARKPAPERTGPVRSWNAANGADGSTAPAASNGATNGAWDGATNDAATGHARGTDPHATELPGAEPGEPASPGGAVDAGYRVIEDYLAQGRAAAEQLGVGQGLAGGLASASSFQGLTARLFQDGLVWLEHLSKLAGSFEEPSADRAASRQAAAQETLVRVSSKAPAEVDLRLAGGTKAQAFAVHPLRCAESEARELDDIQLERHAGRMRLSVFVRDGQAAGLYTGVVVDRRDGSIQGTLSVRIGDGAPS